MGTFREVKAKMARGKLGKESEYSEEFSDYTKVIPDGPVTGFERWSRCDWSF